MRIQWPKPLSYVNGVGVRQVQATLWSKGWNSSNRMTVLVFHSLPLWMSHVLSLCKNETGFGLEGEKQSSVLRPGLGAWKFYSSDTHSLSHFGQVTLNLSVLVCPSVKLAQWWEASAITD